LRTLLAAALALLIAASAAPAMAAPEARFKVTPKSPLVGQLAKLNARASKCKRCRYRWHRMQGKKARKLGKGRGRVLRYRFRSAGVKRIRLTVTDRKGRRARRTKKVRIRRPGSGAPGLPPGQGAPGGPPPVGPPPLSPLPPIAQPSCAAGATPAADAGAVRTAVGAGQNVCVTAAIGDVDLSGLRSDGMRFVGTQGAGSLGAVGIQNSSGITLRARFRSAGVTGSDRITIEQSVIGGTSSARTLDVLLRVEDGSDVTVRDSDLGWTTVPDVSGSEGYGIRVFGGIDRLRIERNYIHHIGADAMQFSFSGADAVIDRNEVAYAARPESSDEHSDDLQIVSNGPNMQVTNNYFHHCGWFTATGPTTGCNSMALHAGTSNSLLYANNVEAHALGLPFIGDLGTGGTERSNASFRRNTWWDNGTQFGGTPDLQWGLDGGSNNLWERNVVVSRMLFSSGAGFAQSGTTARNNLVGGYAMNAIGECIAASCNPAGAEPIGYRKPAGVHW